MTHEIIFAGFGGQGILSAAKLLAYAAMHEGKNVSWLPSYGPEKRGGTSNCHVVISDDPVGSPFINTATAVVLMSMPALDKFESLVVSGGVLIYDSDTVKKEPVRKDLKIKGIPAARMANELGLNKLANMILLGALVKETNAVSRDAILKSIPKILSEDKQHMIPDEIKTFELGVNYEG